MAGIGFRWLGGRESRAVITVSGKAVEVRWSAAAERMLTMRKTPLVVELELAFACMARKTVRFDESPTLTAPSGISIPVTETLALQIVTSVPDACTPDALSGTVRNPALREFVPRWVRIDWVKGAWIGEYGW
ncbi:MAG: hypothetical protein ACYDHY_16170 [Acidiferrobacterales bacterium]